MPARHGPILGDWQSGQWVSRGASLVQVIKILEQRGEGGGRSRVAPLPLSHQTVV